MAWTLGGTRVYVTELGATSKQIIARLQPLGGGTIHQIFGYENSVLKVRGYVVGDTDLTALKTMTEDGLATHNFVGPDEDFGNWMVSTYSWTRVPAIWQTLTATCTDPLYQVDLELFK